MFSEWEVVNITTNFQPEIEGFISKVREIGCVYLVSNKVTSFGTVVISEMV